MFWLFKIIHNWFKCIIQIPEKTSSKINCDKNQGRKPRPSFELGSGHPFYASHVGVICMKMCTPMLARAPSPSFPWNWPIDNKGLTKPTLCGVVFFKLNTFLIMFSQVLSIDSTCSPRTWVYRGSIFFFLVLILCIPAYLGIKGEHFFTDFRFFFWLSFYVQIGVLQFVSRVRFYAKVNITNLYVTNLY